MRSISRLYNWFMGKPEPLVRLSLWTPVRVVLALVGAVAFTASILFLSGKMEAQRVENSNPEMVAELYGANRGDILTMKDGTYCVVVRVPWDVFGRPESEPELLIRCGASQMEYGGSIQDHSLNVVKLTKDDDMQVYNAYAGMYLRQLKQR